MKKLLKCCGQRLLGLLLVCALVLALVPVAGAFAEETTALDPAYEYVANFSNVTVDSATAENASYIDLGVTMEDLGITDSFTVEVWIKSDQNDERIVVSDYTSTTKMGFSHFLGGGYGIKNYIEDAKGTITNGSFQANDYKTPNEWQHLAMVIDGTELTNSFYVNGHLVETKTWLRDAVFNKSGGTIKVAVRGDIVAKQRFNGKASDVRIWNDVRTDEEISTNYNKRLTGNEENLAGYWKLDEKDGTVAYDATANGNNGTYVNATHSTPEEEPVDEDATVYDVFAANTVVYDEDGNATGVVVNENWDDNLVTSNNVMMQTSAGWRGSDGYVANSDGKVNAVYSTTAGGYAIFKVPLEENSIVETMKLVINSRTYSTTGSTYSISNIVNGAYTDVYKAEYGVTNGRDTTVDVTDIAKGWTDLYVKATFPKSAAADWSALWNIRAVGTVVANDAENPVFGASYDVLSANTVVYDANGNATGVVANENWDDNVLMLKNADLKKSAGWYGSGNYTASNHDQHNAVYSSGNGGSAVLAVPLTTGATIQTMSLTINARNYAGNGASFAVSNTANGTYTDVFKAAEETSGRDVNVDVTEIVKGWDALYIRVTFPNSPADDWCAVYNVRAAGTMMAGEGTPEIEDGFPVAVEIQQGDSMELFAGFYGHQLTSKLLPEGSFHRPVEWFSSDESIVTVSNEGMLTTKNVGTATVTVRTKDGKLSDSITVTVKEYTPQKGEYSFLVIPDTQNACTFYPDMLQSINEWIKDNKESQNIEFVMHVGDFTNSNSAGEWEKSAAAFGSLDLPFVGVLGNHDYPNTSEVRDSSLFNQYFPVSSQQAQDTWGGAYEEGKADNVYHVFNVGGVDYLIVALEFGPRDEVVAWANDIVAQYPNHRTIVLTHAYANTSGLLGHTSSGSPYTYGIGSDPDETVNDGVDLWNKLVSKHENIFMVICGHMNSEDIVVHTAEGDHGNTVYQVLANAQDYEGSGIGMIMLMKFNETDGTVSFDWYSTYKEAYFQEENQFSLEYDSTPLADKAAAAAVDAKIDAIGNVTVDSGDVIKAARDAYDALTDAQKALVKGLDTLIAAETAYEDATKAPESSEPESSEPESSEPESSEPESSESEASKPATDNNPNTGVGVTTVAACGVLSALSAAALTISSKRRRVK